tara:strand:+ start:42 stop:473 length:432 start_codon:yes stop_codon:yes gene_type:complete
MDEILNWHLWMYIGIFLFILEVFTPGFILACIGVGSFAGALSAFFGFSMDIQLLVFSISTLISLFLIRPILYKKSESKLKTNTEALIGRVGTVTEKIDCFASGRVSIDGDQWKAISATTMLIEPLEKVIVTEINSTIITVKKI